MGHLLLNGGASGGKVLFSNARLECCGLGLPTGGKAIK
jgi:hypothetical protein